MLPDVVYIYIYGYSHSRPARICGFHGLQRLFTTRLSSALAAFPPRAQPSQAQAAQASQALGALGWSEVFTNHQLLVDQKGLQVK